MSAVGAHACRARAAAPRGAAARAVAVASLERALAHLEGGSARGHAARTGRARRFGQRPGGAAMRDPRRRASSAGSRPRGKLGLGESYMAGEWDCRDLVGALRAAAPERRAPRSQRHPRLRRVLEGAAAAEPPQRPARARAATSPTTTTSATSSSQLMLDETMTYSCAVFETPDEPLAEAQRRKLRRDLRQARARPRRPRARDRLRLGRLRDTAARRVRLPRHRPDASRPRRRRSRASASAAAGLDDRIDDPSRRTTATHRRPLHEGRVDRDARGDRREAVRHASSPRSTGCSRPAAARASRRSSIPDDRWDRYRRTPDWIERYVFPGCLIPSLGALAVAAPRSSRLSCHEVEEIGPHYAETLRRWRATFHAQHRRGARARLRRAASSAPGTSTSPSARPASGCVRSATSS